LLPVMANPIRYAHARYFGGLSYLKKIENYLT
jgi:hypothetical protein